MKDTKVEVYLTPYISEKPDLSQKESLGKITIQGAHDFLNMLLLVGNVGKTCGTVVAQYSDTVISGIVRDPELHIYKTYDQPQCTLCGAKTVKECANILRAGRCPCDTVGVISELIAQAKHQYQK